MQFNFLLLRPPTSSYTEKSLGSMLIWIPRKVEE